MVTDALTLSLQPASVATGEGLRLTIEQAPIDQGSLSLADLNQMVSRARSGLSARTWRPSGCAATISAGEVVVETAVRAWPSAAALPYTITAALGAFSQPSALVIEREFDLLMAHTDQVELPYRCTGVSLSWQTPCYNRFGEVTTRPALTVSEDRITSDAQVWGVLRVRAQAHGFSHPLTMRFPRVLGQRITEVKNHATAAWTDASGPRASGCDIDLPACVADLLAACPGGRPLIDIDVEADEDGIPTVYYSTCTGEVILVRYE
jgi:hypothetical protein